MEHRNRGALYSMHQTRNRKSYLRDYIFIGIVRTSSQSEYDYEGRNCYLLSRMPFSTMDHSKRFSAEMAQNLCNSYMRVACRYYKLDLKR